MTKRLFIPHTCLAGLLSISAVLTSCKRLIEIPPNPPTSITTAQEFADSAITMTAIAGIYSYPPNGATGFTYNDGLLSPYTGLSSDELNTSYTDHTYTDFYNENLEAKNYTIVNLWGNPYTALYPVNATLEGIAASTGLSASLKQQLTGELKVVRALYHFTLVNLFGPVPVIITSDYKKNAQLGRSPEDSVYAQIIRDLLDAKAALPVTYPSPGRVRPNKYTAQAFLAKVYLYRQQWQAAYDEANAVLSTGNFPLVTDVNKVFLDGSTEAIWQLPASNINNVTTEAANYIPYQAGLIPNFFLSPQLISTFESGDKRFSSWVNAIVAPVGNTTKTFYIPFKYKQRVPASPIEDFMIFRSADLYLIRAEAAAHLGHTTDALADINLVRARAGLGASTASAASQDDVLKAVMHERQTELFTEWGNRWFDLKRTGSVNAVMGPLKPNWQATDSLYPIPQAQLDINIALKQNPGYQ